MGELARAGGRFRSSYDKRTLLDVVLAVAGVASPSDPAALTQLAYNAGRTAAGYADAPSGKQIAARLGMPWRELVELAVDPTLDKDKTIGRQLGREDEEWLGPGTVRAALKTVAMRLGRSTLRPDEYLAERERVLDEARRAVRHKGEPLLPSEGQILRIAGSWDKALRLAGLKPRERDDHKGVSVVEALEWALESRGALPTRRELEAFAASNGFSVAWKEMAWSAALVELRRRRAEWGKWTPPASPPLGSRPDYAVEVSLPASTARRRRARWTREECVNAIARLLGELGGERLTQRAYQQRARLDPDLPPLSSLQRHGTFAEIVADARCKRGRRH